MPTRRSEKAATTPATTPVPGFAAAQVTPTGFSAQALRLPGFRGAWTYMVNPAKLVCRNGRIVPTATKAWMEPGFMANQAGGVGQGMIADLEARGFVKVPHTHPAVAFGQPTIPPGQTTTDRKSTYLTEWKGVDGSGRPCTYWADVWERPRSVGSLTMWDRDEAGRDEWLASCIPLMLPNGIESVHIDLALRSTLRRAYALLDRVDTPRGRRHLLSVLKHIPAEHMPEDLKDYLEARKAS